jgi:TonB family protein
MCCAALHLCARVFRVGTLGVHSMAGCANPLLTLSNRAVRGRKSGRAAARASFGCVCLLLVSTLLSRAAFAQSPEFEELASKVSEKIERKEHKIILVADFIGPQGKLSELGRDLAGQFSAALAKVSKDYQLLPRENISATWDSSLDMTHDADAREGRAARALARIVNAQVVVTGTLAPKNGAVELRVKVWDIPKAYGRSEVWDPVKLGDISATIPLNEAQVAELAKELAPASVGPTRMTAGYKPPTSPKPQIPTIPDAAPGPDGTVVYRAGRNGVGNPVCVACPAPEPSEEARQKKIGGVVILQVTITPEGRAKDIEVISTPGYGLEDNAREGVSTWRFKPALGPDRKPVAVRTQIEVTFRFQ